MSLPAGVSFDRKRVGLWAVFLALLVGLLWVVWQYVGTLIVGVFAYYVARPVLDRLDDRVPTRTLAVVVTLLVVALPVILLVGWTIAVVVGRLSALLGSATTDQLQQLLGPYVQPGFTAGDIEQLVRDVAADPSQLAQLNGLNQQVMPLLNAAVASLVSVLNALLHLFIALIVTFYLLRDDYRIAEWARETVLEPDGVFERYLVAVDRDLQNVFFGNILNALLTGVLGAVTYTVLNAFAPAGLSIPDPVLVGLLSGVASLIPVIGIKLVWIPLGGYLLALALTIRPATTWFVAVFAGVSVVVVDTIPDQLLRPYVSGRTLHVGAVMLAYTVGPLLLGWYGIFLGPFLLVVGVEFARHVFPWLVDPDYVPAGPDVSTFAGGAAETRSPAADAEANGDEPAAERADGDGDADADGPADADAADDPPVDDGPPE
ncbi:MAG: AI-2E family transporter [Haloarculaceae archaeon]